MGVGERSSAGALPVGGFGFLGVRPLFQAAVTSQPKANSQVRLCRGWREHSQWGSDSSDCRAGKLELDARCWWRSVWQLRWVLAGWDAQASGAWRLRAWMRRWARVDGSQPGPLDWTAGRWGMAFCISVPDETRHGLLPVCPSVLSVSSVRLPHLPVCPFVAHQRQLVISQSVNHSVSVLYDQAQAQAQACVGRPVGLRAPLTPSPSLPRGPALNFCRWGLACCMPTGTFCRPTDAGLCVGLTRGRGCSDVNASAIVVKIHPSWHFLVLSSPGSRDCRCCQSASCATSLSLPVCSIT